MAATSCSWSLRRGNGGTSCRLHAGWKNPQLPSPELPHRKLIPRPTIRPPTSEDPVDLERRQQDQQYQGRQPGAPDGARPVGGVSLVGKLAAGLAILTALG